MNKADFILRLEQALDDIGVTEYGRNTFLSKELGVTKSAVGKWFNPEEVTMPRYDILIKIAMLTNKSIDFLLTGCKDDRAYKIPIFDNKVAIDESIKFKTKNKLGEITSLIEMTAGFAVYIDDDSMFSTHGISFPKNSLMVFDREIDRDHIKSGNIVYAKLAGGEKGVCREYIQNGTKEYLKPLNPTFENEFNFMILGIYQYCIFDFYIDR